MKFNNKYYIFGLLLVLVLSFLIYVGNDYYQKSNLSGKNLDFSSYEEKGYSKAFFAGGCFWCTESDFEKQYGVVDVISGYSGGDEKNPSYIEVSSGSTGHYESVEVFYDSSKVSYSELLDIFWRHVDPTDSGGQFVDRGNQYRAVIFYQNEFEKNLAEKSKDVLDKSGKYDKKIVTEIINFKSFYPAEDYHQDFYKRNSLKYNYYRFNSGRDDYIKSIWNEENYVKPIDSELKYKLTSLQYEVTQNEGTERPFDNEYWDNHNDGIYLDIVSGEVLFSSKDKYDSGTGWPSFTKPLEINNIVKKEDNSFFSERIEVRSKNADSHLGHVFSDGPEPEKLRYCMNSAALKFVSKEELEREGYGNYSYLFE